MDPQAALATHHPIVFWLPVGIAVHRILENFPWEFSESFSPCVCVCVFAFFLGWAGGGVTWNEGKSLHGFWFFIRKKVGDDETHF